MVLISTYTFLVSKTLISNLCNLRLKESLLCSRNRNVRGILFQIRQGLNIQVSVQ